MESTPTKTAPTPEELDEPIRVPATPAEFLEGVLAVEPDGENDERPDE